MKNKKYIILGLLAVVVLGGMSYLGFSASSGQGNMFTIPTQKVTLRPVGEVFMITSPQNNSIVSGILQITANKNISRLLISNRDLDNRSYSKAVVPSSNIISLDTTLLKNGMYHLYGFTESGSTATAPVSITVKNKFPQSGVKIPKISIYNDSVDFELAVKNNIRTGNYISLGTGDSSIYKNFSFSDICRLNSSANSYQTFICKASLQSVKPTDILVLSMTTSGPKDIFTFTEVRNGESLQL